LVRIAWLAVSSADALAGDTTALALQAASLRACLSAGGIGACPAAGHFPLLQFGPAVFLEAVGVSPEMVVRVFALTSVVAFVALLRTGWRALSSTPDTQAAWLAVVGTGPLLYYAQTSWGESLAAWAVVTALVTCWSTPRWVVAVSFALAGVTKEFSPVVMAVLAALAIVAGDLNADRRRLVAVAAGVGLGVAVMANAGLNLVRFGVPYNQILLGPEMLSVPLAERPGFFLGLWLSPNGGLVAFWPTFIAVLVWALWSARRSRLAQVSVLGTLGLLISLTVGLSGWWAPFGWIAWGPRLLLPWIPACLLILLRGLGASSGGRPWALPVRALAAAAAAAAGLLHFGATVTLEPLQAVFGPAPGCPTLPSDPVRQADYYFHCMGYYLWDPRIPLARLFEASIRPPGTVFGLAYLLAAGAWAWLAFTPSHHRTKKRIFTPAP
jgi:hypothetical protein